MTTAIETTPKPIEPYMAIALQPQMKGAYKRAEIKENLEHLAELMHAAVLLAGIDLPVRLLAVPEGTIQGFTDEIFDWDHEEYVDKMALDLPGEETKFLGDLAREFNTYIIAQAKVRHPDFEKRFFNCAFAIDPRGEIVLKHYKLQVFAREHSTVPHDVWDKWTQLYGTGLDAFFPVADTEIGRLGACICMEGSYPETTRGLAMNGAEIVYRPSYPEPYVSNGLWEVQNRARALDNTMYVIAPNCGSYQITKDAKYPLDIAGGHSMIVDYQGRVISNHASGGASSWAGAIVDIEALRSYRERSLWGNWLKDLRTEQFKPIYEKPLFEKNRYLKRAPLRHAEGDEEVKLAVKRMHDRGIWVKPTNSRR